MQSMCTHWIVDTDMTPAHTCTNYANCGSPFICNYQTILQRNVIFCGIMWFRENQHKGTFVFVFLLREIPRAKLTSNIQKILMDCIHAQRFAVFTLLLFSCLGNQRHAIFHAMLCHPRSQILKHCCLNHNCSLLFLPHPHLSARIG